jgi:hypothetical protein
MQFVVMDTRFRVTSVAARCTTVERYLVPLSRRMCLMTVDVITGASGTGTVMRP